MSKGDDGKPKYVAENQRKSYLEIEGEILQENSEKFQQIGIRVVVQDRIFGLGKTQVASNDDLFLKRSTIAQEIDMSPILNSGLKHYVLKLQ